MGKFNLNQILNNASRQAAEGGNTPPRPAESEIKKISVFDLVPSEDNFYSLREIEELKAAIEIAGKVLQNLTVVPLDGGKYKVIAGHRRRLASLALVEDGKPQYEFVTCSVEPNEEAAEDQEIRDGLNLIVTNSQREKTAWDKIEEVRYLRDVLEKAKTRPRFVAVLQRIVATVFGDSEVQADGTRDFIAKVLHTSPAQIGRYDTIIRHLSPEFKEELKADRINLSTAYELAGLPEEDQRAAFEEYQRTGEISIKAARERKPQAAPSPPTPQDEEKNTPPAEPVREREQTPPPRRIAYRPPYHNRESTGTRKRGGKCRRKAHRTRRTRRKRAGREKTRPTEKPSQNQRRRESRKRRRVRGLGFALTAENRLTRRGQSNTAFEERRGGSL